MAGLVQVCFVYLCLGHAPAVAFRKAQLDCRDVEKIMERYAHCEMGYRSCLGIIRFGQRYPVPDVEAAAQRALLTGAVSYSMANPEGL